VCAAPSVADALAALSRAFGTAGLRWYVFDAQAVLAYGRPRLTADLDVTVDPGPERAVELQSLLAAEGIEVRAPLPAGSRRPLGRSDLRPQLERLLELVR
jgi:hypothetical protein